MKAPVAKRIKQGADPNKIASTLKWLEDPNNAVITLADADYPAQLLNIPTPPPLLYFKGCRELLKRPALAVVGSRNATPQGLSNAEAFSEAASNAGLCIVSGMALGIDTAAHHCAALLAASQLSAPVWILFIRPKITHWLIN